jgi:hypothetical protein
MGDGLVQDAVLRYDVGMMADGADTEQSESGKLTGARCEGGKERDCVSGICGNKVLDIG